MEAKIIIGDAIVLLAGILLLGFNRPIGEFAKKTLDPTFGLKILELMPWFPRLNVILIGAFLALIGFLGLWDEIAKR
ncbi:MAG: hypothetical protein ACKVRN_02705 [Pyrinomonadaceae bacterium]